jgi:hypothetical protein
MQLFSLVFVARQAPVLRYIMNGVRQSEWTSEKPSGQYLSFICVESLQCRGFNSNPGHFRGSAIILFFVWRIAGAIWRVVKRIVAGIGDLMQRTKDGQAQVGYSVIGRSGGQVTPCVIYTMHKETSSTGFLVEPQNQCRQVSWLSLKSKVDGFLVWASKPTAPVW